MQFNLFSLSFNLPMPNLDQEFARLNDEQKTAVLADGNTVVMAGPGSGKTATLVIKIARLLAEKVTPPAGLSCLTFNNDAVREFRMRLQALGIHPRRSSFFGTVHSFCLNRVVRPYAGLIDKRFGAEVNVAGPNVAEKLFAEAVGRFMDPSQARWLSPTITRYRRAKACGEDLSGFADNDPLIAQAYDELLLENRLIDFEGIILVALHLIRQQDWIRRLIAARFPWLVVDEYQDLGGPLHSIVINLVDLAGVKVFAVGDPDQTIYDFTGASPKYLSELAERDDFEPVRLKFNYRSGQRIIDASQAALAPPEPRGYVPDPERKEQGEIIFDETDGSDLDHAVKVVEAIRSFLSSGIKPEEIAILYRSTGTLVEAIRDELEKNDIDFIWERDTRFPNSPFIVWLQRISAWAITEPKERECTFAQLFQDFYLLLQAAGKIEGDTLSLDNRVMLFRLLKRPLDERTLLRDWLTEAEETMEFGTLLAAAEEYADDLDNYDELTKQISSDGAHHGTLLHEFAAKGKHRGKVIVTTFHASKGRQFDAVIIPGCAEGALPAWTWSRRDRDFVPPSERVLAETRRLFYVGLSRARHFVDLVHAENWQDRYGHLRHNGPSRFVTEIQTKLRQ
jgi:DNA helicase-2/ATP-dependent DNA helicase PcrA